MTPDDSSLFDPSFETAQGLQALGFSAGGPAYDNISAQYTVISLVNIWPKYGNIMQYLNISDIIDDLKPDNKFNMTTREA